MRRGRGHGHGHAHDRGLRGTLRYLRWFPQMWRSEINDAVVDRVDPRPGERVIDIGAGLGAGAFRAARAGAAVIAVEPTPTIRKVLSTRRRLSRRGADIEVVDGAAERIPADDGSIDAIWAVNTMHHWTDVERAVAEIARVLGKDGRILLVDEDFADPSHPDHERFGSDHHEDHGFTTIDAVAVGELLRAVGLTDVDTSIGPIAGRPVTGVAARGRDPSDGRYPVRHPE